jgi:cyclopropane fatty-acyl-phospholipid synthase-like methyltransferase
MKNIKRMKLYHHPDRIYNELNATGHDKDDTLTVQDLSSFDQYHYLGTDAVDDAILRLKIGSEDKIIDVGSGIGGPARYLAEKTGCQVTALELQPELHNIGCSLTERCGLSGLVTHMCGDIHDFSEKNSNFDVVVSWLSFLHIPDRSSLLRKCYNILKPDGKMFIEDFCKRSEFDVEETKVLSRDISCVYLPTSEEYKKLLIESGFPTVKLTDKTDCWKNFVEERMENFIENRNHQIEIHNIEIVEDLEDFYEKMAWLFEGGNLGGLRITAKKG